MKRVYLLWGVCWCCCVVMPVSAQQSDWRLTAPPAPLSEAEQALIGHTICGREGFEVDEGVLRCDTCPEFTGNPGSREGLEIGSVIRGRFSSPGVSREWLLDTDGCEAHFDSFGGAILLGSIPTGPVEGSPMEAALGTAPERSVDRRAKLIFYKPGFRVNDCLVIDGDKGRSLTVCNEADMAQGEVIGHISLMEVTRRGLNRWRLVRWYDNSGSDMQEVLSVTPLDIRVLNESRKTLLQIRMGVLETSRQRYEQSPEPAASPIELQFHRTGQRFFPTRQTQSRLAEIGRLIRKMLDEER